MLHLSQHFVRKWRRKEATKRLSQAGRRSTHTNCAWSERNISSRRVNSCSAFQNLAQSTVTLRTVPSIYSATNPHLYDGGGGGVNGSDAPTLYSVRSSVSASVARSVRSASVGGGGGGSDVGRSVSVGRMSAVAMSLPQQQLPQQRRAAEFSAQLTAAGALAVYSGATAAMLPLTSVGSLGTTGQLRRSDSAHSLASSKLTSISQREPAPDSTLHVKYADHNTYIVLDAQINRKRPERFQCLRHQRSQTLQRRSLCARQACHGCRSQKQRSQILPQLRRAFDTAAAAWMRARLRSAAAAAHAQRPLALSPRRDCVNQHRNR